jgi:hypothetical protein
MSISVVVFVYMAMHLYGIYYWVYLKAGLRPLMQLLVSRVVDQRVLGLCEAVLPLTLLDYGFLPPCSYFWARGSVVRERR